MIAIEKMKYSLNVIKCVSALNLNNISLVKYQGYSDMINRKTISLQVSMHTDTVFHFQAMNMCRKSEDMINISKILS